MTPKRAALFLSVGLFSVAVAACDSAKVYEDCASEGKLGSGEERCMVSTFPSEDVWARNTVGFVSYGIERVPNAIVRIDGMSATTDASGFYRFDSAPFRYDVTARLDKDVIAFQGAAYRFLDLAVERDVPIRGWTSRVALTVPGAPRPGNALAAFVSGDIVGATGDVASGVVVASRTFDTSVKVHVVEYPIAAGLTGAVGKGMAEVRVQGNGVSAATVTLEPVEKREAASFVADVPSGFTAEEAEVLLDFGNLFSQSLVRKVPLRTRIDLPVMNDAKWTVRVRATRDGAVASSGRLPFAPREDIRLTLFDPPAPVAPAADGVAQNGVVVASGKGVFEHVLVPLDGAGGGVTLHLATASPEAHVPDLVALGLPPATGRWSWTVRHFPDFEFVEALSGMDARLYRAVSASSPRSVVLP